MKKKIILVACLFLTACGHDAPFIKPEKPEKVVVKEIQYVVKIPPKELITIPPQVDKIDVDAAKQSDIAKWIIAGEERTRKLEEMIRQLALFFKLEQLKLDEEAIKKNKEEAEKALIQSGQTPNSSTK